MTLSNCILTAHTHFLVRVPGSQLRSLIPRPSHYILTTNDQTTNQPLFKNLSIIVCWVITSFQYHGKGKRSGMGMRLPTNLYTRNLHIVCWVITSFQYHERQEKWDGNETSWAHIWEQRISNSTYS